MSTLEQFQQAKDKKAFLRGLANAHQYFSLRSLAQHLVTDKNIGLLEFLFIEMDVTRPGKNFLITLTPEFVELIKSVDNGKLFTRIRPQAISTESRKGLKLCYQWFVETKDHRILQKLLKASIDNEWLNTKAQEVINYAIEWNDNQLLKVCCLFPITVPALKLMINKVPVQLELLIVDWLASKNAYCETDIIDCLIVDYKGENKRQLMANFCILSRYSVDVVRRVAEHFPEALHYVQDWSVQSDSQEVCDLFMFNVLGHKLCPSFLSKSDPEYLGNYQKEIRLSEYVNQLYGPSLGYRYSDHFRKYNSETRLKLCKIANIRISIGDLMLCLRHYMVEDEAESDAFIGGNDYEYLGDEGFADFIRTENEFEEMFEVGSTKMLTAFIAYMDAQTDEYRQSFRESLEIYREMNPSGRAFPDWVHI